MYLPWLQGSVKQKHLLKVTKLMMFECSTIHSSTIVCSQLRMWLTDG